MEKIAMLPPFRMYWYTRLKDLSAVAVEGQKAGIIDHDINVFTVKARYFQP